MRIPSIVITLTFGVPGFCMQVYGIANGALVWALAGSLLLSIGLGNYIAHKGYHPAWGLWGVVPIMGVLLLAIQWPRQEMERILADDPKRDPGAVLGGRPLLAVMAPAGIAVMVLSAFFIGDSAGTDSSVPASPLDELEASSTAPSDTKGDDPNEAAPADGDAQSEDQSQDAKAGGNLPELPKLPEVPTLTASWSENVQRGMTSEQVEKLAGGPGDTLVSGPLGMRITRWKTKDGHYVFVRFRNNLVQRTAGSASPDDDTISAEDDTDTAGKEDVHDAVERVLGSKVPPEDAKESKADPQSPKTSPPSAKDK